MKNPCAGWTFGVLLVAAFGSCAKPADKPAASAAASSLPTDEQIKAMLDEEINYTYTQRSLNLNVQAAWQIMHGVVPFGTKFFVYRNDTEQVPALEWVLDGNAMKGWTPQHGDMLGDRRGLKMLLETGKFGQGHPDQWLSILGQSGIKSDHKLLFDGKEYQVRDVMVQALHDVHSSPEWSWTLTSALIYLGPDATWVSGGEEWNVERLVAKEVKEDLSTSACGGTHRLSALNRAVKEYRKKHGEPKGAWADADKKVRDSIEKAHEFQQPDGALSNNFFIRPGASADNVAMMYSTGHTVEFLAMAVTDEELDAPWMKKAVVKLCELFHNTRAIDVECGSLYHACNGLKKYRERKFGPWTPPAGVGPTASPKGMETPRTATLTPPAKEVPVAEKKAN